MHGGFTKKKSINGGESDNCPMKKGKGFGYYVGYIVGWLLD